MPLFLRALTLLPRRSQIYPLFYDVQFLGREVAEMGSGLDLYQQAVVGVSGNDHCAILAAFHRGGVAGEIHTFGRGLSFMTPGTFDGKQGPNVIIICRVACQGGDFGYWFGRRQLAFNDLAQGWRIETCEGKDRSVTGAVRAEGCIARAARVICTVAIGT